MPEDMSDRMPEDMPDRMPEDLPDRMPEDLPVRKCINVMVGITRSKVMFACQISYSMWVCLKIGYMPNYSHLIGIMIINHWV